MTIREFISNQPDNENITIFSSCIPGDGNLFSGTVAELKQEKTLLNIQIRLYYWNEETKLILSVILHDYEFKKYIYNNGV